MDNLPLAYHDWSDRLAMDVALMLENSGDVLDDVMLRHSITAEDMVRFNGDRVFLKKVGELRGEIRANGMTFKLKARAQAEELLTTSWTLIHSPDVSAAVKADLIKSTVKWGGLEPKTHDGFDGGSSSGVSITINLDQISTQQEVKESMKVIDHAS